jgi:hypothetical protein
MVAVSLDSLSCEVTLFDPVSVVYRDVTRQAKGLYRLKYVGVLGSGLAYLSQYNSGWFCHRNLVAFPLAAEAAQHPNPTTFAHFASSVLPIVSAQHNIPSFLLIYRSWGRQPPPHCATAGVAI